MDQYRFTDCEGSFQLKNPGDTGYLYFPIAGETGIKSSITPDLGGDCKIDQNHFLMQPVSAEDLHNNKGTRNFWCKVKGKGCWSATGCSAEEMSHKFSEGKEEVVLDGGLMWHKITRKSKKFELESQILSFVPVADPDIEIMIVTLANRSQKVCTLEAFGAIPIYGRSADNLRDHRHVTSLLHQIWTIEKGIKVKPTLSFDERGHQLNDRTYFFLGFTENGENPKGFYPTVEDYLLEGGNYEMPGVVIKGQPGMGPNRYLEGYEAMGACQFEEITLSADQTMSYVLLLGSSNNGQRAEEVSGKYHNLERVMEEYDQTKQYWLEKNNISFHTEDERFNQFMKWVNFQPILRRIYGCSFLPHHDYGKGGRGWRDLWQDCLALIMMNPEGVRNMLLDNFKGVRLDGTNATIIGTGQGEFVADRNNITRVWMDHGVWPLMTCKLYIDQTGDLDILLKEVSYFKDKQVVRGNDIDLEYTEGLDTNQRDETGTIYYGSVLEHLMIQNLTAFYEVGEHNHMRLRGADWNDALDMASKRGESVAFSAAYAGNLESLAELLEALKTSKKLDYVDFAEEMNLLFTQDPDMYLTPEKKSFLLETYCKTCTHHIRGTKISISVSELIENLRGKASFIKQHIRKTEWIRTSDEEMGWFNSYYDDDGKRVEGEFDTQTRMMLTGQVFTIMSGTAEEEQIKAITQSADRHLYEESLGGYRLNTNFQEIKTNLGRMFGFAYGHKENGAVFSHMSTMYANALYKRGHAKEGHKALAALYKQSVNFEVSKIYPGIPEYFNAKGRGMYHYLTGAASWYMLTVITEMFGVKGVLGNMMLAPQLLIEQFDKDGKASISFVFQKKKWKITYVNREQREVGNYKIETFFLDGKQYSVNSEGIALTKEEIKNLDDTKVHEIVADVKGW